MYQKPSFTGGEEESVSRKSRNADARHTSDSPVPTGNSLSDEESPELRMFHNHMSMQAGAYQNGTWVAAAAKAGAEDGYGLIGGSCIIAPTGEIVAQALTEEDEVISYDCDLDLGQYIKNTIFDFDAHRRIEHYSLITEQTGIIPQPED